MKSIALSLAAVTMGIALAMTPAFDAAARSPSGPAVGAPSAPAAPPRIVIPNRGTQLPPQTAGGGLVAKPKPKQPLVRHCSTPDGCYWLDKLCTRDGGGMSTNPDGTGTCTN